MEVKEAFRERLQTRYKKKIVVANREIVAMVLWKFRNQSFQNYRLTEIVDENVA